METITEAMLAVLLEAHAVKTIALTESKGRGKLKRSAWAITVELVLPRSEQKVRELFASPPMLPTALSTQGELIENLATWRERTKKGNRVQAMLATYRETISPTGKPRTVASLDRYINHLRELGARKVSIEIHLGAKT